MDITADSIRSSSSNLVTLILVRQIKAIMHRKFIHHHILQLESATEVREEEMVTTMVEDLSQMSLVVLVPISLMKS